MKRSIFSLDTVQLIILNWFMVWFLIFILIMKSFIIRTIRSINYTDNHSFSYFFSLLLDITLDCVLRNPVNLAKMSLFAIITSIFQLYNRSLCTVIGISPSRSTSRMGLVTGSVLGTQFYIQNNVKLFWLPLDIN